MAEKTSQVKPARRMANVAAIDPPIEETPVEVLEAQVEAPVLVELAPSKFVEEANTAPDPANKIEFVQWSCDSALYGMGMWYPAVVTERRGNTLSLVAFVKSSVGVISVASASEGTQPGNWRRVK